MGFVDGTVQVLDLKGEQAGASLNNPATPLALVSWSPDEQYLAVGSASSVLVYTCPTWNVVTNYQKHTNTVKAVAWSPDDTRLVTGNYDNIARIWRL